MYWTSHEVLKFGLSNLIGCIDIAYKAKFHWIIIAGAFLVRIFFQFVSDKLLVYEEKKQSNLTTRIWVLRGWSNTQNVALIIRRTLQCLVLLGCRLFLTIFTSKKVTEIFKWSWNRWPFWDDEDASLST